MTEDATHEVTPARPPRPANCPSCNAPFADVPDVTDTCPHCSHPLLERIEHFGAAQWHRIPARFRDGDPETHPARQAQ